MKLLLPLILLTAPLVSNAEVVKAVQNSAQEVEYIATCSNGNKVKFKAGADLSRSSAQGSESCHKAGFGKAVSVSASAQSRSSLKATDHNSSRSNKTSHTPIAAGDDAGQGDSDSDDATRATDYNSSRSNKHFAASDIDDADGSDESEENSGTRATDYNSSRSNKADGAKEDAEDDDVKEKGKSKRKD